MGDFFSASFLLLSSPARESNRIESNRIDPRSTQPGGVAQKLFNGRALDGPTIATLLPVLADKLNSDGELLPREVWRLMEEHRLNKVLAEYRDEVKAWVQARVAEVREWGSE